VVYEIEVGGRIRQVTLHRTGDRFVVAVDGKETVVDAVRVDNATLSLLVSPGSGGPASSREVMVAPDSAGTGRLVQMGPLVLGVALNGRRNRRHKDDTGRIDAGPQRLVAPMPGKIVRVLVQPGEPVKARQSLVVIEAMKMENELRAAGDGTMAEIHVRDGQSVEAGALLAVIHR
jgi:biotin carboxyl carrier protein